MGIAIWDHDLRLSSQNWIIHVYNRSAIRPFCRRGWNLKTLTRGIAFILRYSLSGSQGIQTSRYRLPIVESRACSSANSRPANEYQSCLPSDPFTTSAINSLNEKWRNSDPREQKWKVRNPSDLGNAPLRGMIGTHHHELSFNPIHIAWIGYKWLFSDFSELTGKPEGLVLKHVCGGRECMYVNRIIKSKDISWNI
jgi:hypothetical protein